MDDQESWDILDIDLLPPARKRQLENSETVIAGTTYREQGLYLIDLIPLSHTIHHKAGLCIIHVTTCIAHRIHLLSSNFLIDNFQTERRSR